MRVTTDCSLEVDGRYLDIPAAIVNKIYEIQKCRSVSGMLDRSPGLLSFMENETTKASLFRLICEDRKPSFC